MELLIELRLTLLTPLHLQPLHQGLDGQALKDNLTDSGARQDPRTPSQGPLNPNQTDIRSLLPL